uniref:Putative methyltransferase n=1 Tax=viral metagenome TaxID=1070528 RepID=A0A6M3KDM4_9ZZZZ
MIFDMPNNTTSNDDIAVFDMQYNSLLDPAWYSITHLPRSADYATILKNVHLASDDVVLDVGGACSYFAHFISPLVREVHLIDSLTGFSCGKPWLASMDTLKSPVRIIEANAAVLPYPDETFNKVFTFSALEHFVDDDDIKCVQEIYRVLKPGGIFAGTVDYNAITERPYGIASICKTYTLRTFFQRIVLAAEFWPVGKVSLLKIPERVTYDTASLLFVLSKGIPRGCVLDVGGKT